MNSTKTRLATLALSLLMAGLALAACGSDSTTVAPATTTTTTTAVATTASNPTVSAASPAATTAPTTSSSTTAPATTSSTTAATAPATTNASTTVATNPTTAPSGGTLPIGNATPVDVSNKIFVDDHSNPLEVLRSFYNAINRKEYVRAYSYWADNSGQNFKIFADGYAKTASVQLSVAAIFGDAGAGNRFYYVPVTINSTTTDGAAQIFAGCYALRQAVPANFAVPPFQPLNIGKANVTAIKSQAEAAATMATNCAAAGAATGNPPSNLTPGTDNTPIDAQNYLDSRNDGVTVIRSFYNAINRKEYVRAYSYWDTEAAKANGLPPAYADFAKGYANTTSVQLTTGKVLTDAGAGQLNSQVPFALVATHTDGKVQNFVGCYTLRHSNPAILTQPPYKPFGIVNAKVQEVAANSNTADLLAKACQ